MLIQKTFHKKRNRMKLHLFVYYFTILIFSSNKIGSVNKKLQKSFDKIFGDGWEERGKKANSNLEDGQRDQRDGIGKVLQSDQNKNYLEQINNETTEQSDIGDQNGNNQQKREIIQKFYAIKEKIKQKGIKYSKNEWTKFEYTIAKKLGTKRSKIYEWKKELGMVCKKIKNEWQKREIICLFFAIKGKIKQKVKKCSNKERSKMDCIIARKLGTHRTAIYKWKREIGVGSKEKSDEIYSKEQKFEKVQQFIEMSKEYKQKGRHSRKEWLNKYCEISKKLGINYYTIKKWKKKFGMSQKRKCYTNEEKLEIMKRYWAMKRNNSKISDAKIAKIMQVKKWYISRWKGQSREENI